MTLTDPTAARALFASRGAWVIAQDHVAAVIGYRKAQRAQVIDGCGAFGRIITGGDVIHGDALIGGIAIECQRAGQGARWEEHRVGKGGDSRGHTRWEPDR